MADNVPITFLTLNVNGLSDRIKRNRIFNTLEMMDVNIIFLQETHVSCQNVASKYASEWKGLSFWSVTSITASCGVAVLFKRDITVSVNLINIDPQGRFCKIHCTIDSNYYQLINIYCPNLVSDRLLFLDTILKLVDRDIVTVLAGDFNFVEDPLLDKNGGSTSNAYKDKSSRMALNKIKFKFKLIDVYRVTNPTGREVTFTYSQGQVGTRLDRIYISEKKQSNLRNINIINVANCDHLAVTTTLSPTEPERPRGVGYWKCNVKTLDDEHFQADLKSAYAALQQQYDGTTDWWEGCKAAFKRLIITHSVRLASNKRNQLNKLNYLISKYTQLGIYFPGRYINLLTKLRAEADALLDNKADGDRIRARVARLNSFHNPAALARETELYNAKRKHISSIKRSDGSIVTDQSDIEQECVNFYKNLLSRETIHPNKWQDLTANLIKLSSLERDSAETPIMYKECVLAISSMHDKKTPGSDGLPPEFYKRFFHLFGKEFVDLFTSELDRLADSQRIGVITLLCKDKSRAEDLAVWRPISLLNTDYKILSKVILNKLKLVAKSIVGPSQTCGIKGRSILDNLHFIRNVFDYCRERKLPCIALCFDQAKAFDRVDHAYLLHILHKLGFGPNIIKLINLLYTDIYSSVLVNGFLSDLFTVTRSMRQGCGLSPLLYAFCIEPLIRLIQSSLLFRGIPMPNGEEARIAAHADDSTVFASNVESVKLALDYFDLYGQASGARLNKEKSVACIATDNTSLIGWPLWLTKVKVVKICGIHFGDNAEDIDEAILINNISSKLKHFGPIMPRSIHTRVAFINVFILAKVWYIAAVKLITAKSITKINSLIFKFVWKSTEKVNRPTVCLPTDLGGLGLTHIKTKCEALTIKHALQAYLQPGKAWASCARYWTNISFNKFFPGSWSNGEIHTLQANNFYKTVISSFSNFKKCKPEPLSLRNIIKTAYNFNISKITKPKVADLDDADRRAEAWKRLKSMDIAPEARDTMWLVSHDALPVAAHIFRFHLLVHNLCVLCMKKVETIEHCLLECDNAAALWEYIFNLHPALSSLRERDVLYLNIDASGDLHTQQYLAVIISTAIQVIWTSRNNTVFQDISIRSTQLISKFNYHIQFRIKCDRHRLTKARFREIWANRPIKNDTD